jgi:gas vesicle protein
MLHLKTIKRVLLLFLGYCFILSYTAYGQCYLTSSDISVELPTNAEQLYEQGVDTTNVDSVLRALRKGKLLKSQYAALFLAEQNNREAIKLIKKKYSQERKYARGAARYLKALKMLNEESAESLLVSFADSLYQSISSGSGDRSERYAYKDATEMLIDLGNYAQFPRIKTEIEHRENDDSGNTFVSLLPQFFDIKQLRSEVIDALIFVLNNYSDSSSRFTVVNYSCLFPESAKLHQALKKAVTDDPSFDVRWWSLVRLKDTYNDAELLDLALNNLNETNNPEEIGRYLSIITGEYDPQSLFLIKDLKNNNPNELVREEAAEIYNDYWWLHFEPYGKAFEYSLSQTLDSLNAYTNDVASYDWLGDQGFVRELINRLDNASRHLARGDSSNTAKQVGNYKERLKEVYEQNQQNNSPRFVTEDGYKFLTKNAEYLLSQLLGHPSTKNKGR